MPKVQRAIAGRPKGATKPSPGVTASGQRKRASGNRANATSMKIRGAVREHTQGAVDKDQRKDITRTVTKTIRSGGSVLTRKEAKALTGQDHNLDRRKPGHSLITESAPYPANSLRNVGTTVSYHHASGGERVNSGRNEFRADSRPVKETAGLLASGQFNKSDYAAYRYPSSSYPRR
jgi:hypothetical protein